ncbi:hypothetical protein [Streptomyces sp. AK02-01A]|uniref:hypothetical protein n=1 Tax=Streptomyces sp. AK02-01A TaxID=3028648 RepID=UPI0029A3890A|nr:hypothetical protein [Streptomyces sp. AK02-01A]MDX3851665.1 hypothetical protein [Streptomyces sp. AK02-01A]
MICNFLLSRRLEPAALAAGLTDAARVPAGQADVRREDDDQAERDWEAPVLCTYHYVRGDVVMSLDIQVRHEPGARPAGAPSSEAELAAAFAGRTGVAVLYPDDRADPETYWLADPVGTVTRARLVASDDEPPRYTVDAVETPVSAFPGAEVTPLAEILRSERIPAPVAEAVGSDSPAAVSLFVWERLGRRMESGWAPSGRYLPELYAEDLSARDAFDRQIGQCAVPERESLLRAVAELDELFREYTVDDAGAASSAAAPGGGGWWWRRRPRRLPWPAGSGSYGAPSSGASRSGGSAPDGPGSGT